MKLYTVFHENREKLLACIQDDTCYDLAQLGFAFQDMNQLISAWTEDLEHGIIDAIAKAPESAQVALDQVRICAPIPHPLQDVICLGINYRDHAQEANRFSKDAFSKERPDTIYFSKRCTTATGSGDLIPLYEGYVDSLDYECELAAVLGKDIKGVTPEEALSAVFGYTIVNDVSARNIQTRHKQWYLGKSLDGFTPMGPCIVTKSHIPDPQVLDLRCTVNGELRQSSNTAYMMQTVAGAISELSQGMTLKAGTIIATGTPAGVGMGMTPPTFLKAGDQVVCEIQKIGRLANTVGD